jgi:histidinol-phosphatase (PHP family)
VTQGQPASCADYHVHTPFCGHAQGATIDYVEAALRAGLREIGFSDHLGRYYLTRSQKKRYWDWGMNQQHLARYFAEIGDLQDVYQGRITIRVGLEVDYIEGAEDALVETLSPYEPDFLLGSIHCIPSIGWKHIAAYANQPSWEIYDSYFRQAESAITSGLFDVLAHPDFIWRYMKWPREHADQIFNRIRGLAALAASKKCAIEINANAFLWSKMNAPLEYDPFPVLLEAIRDSGAAISLGSDAHKPFMVAKGFDEIRSYLQRFDITQQCVFDRRKCRQKSLL